MTELEHTIMNLVVIFKRYAGKDGDDKTLTKKEIKELVKKELPSLLANPKDPKELDQIVRDLDLNGDDKIDFQEFVILIITMANVCEELCNFLMTKTEEELKDMMAKV